MNSSDYPFTCERYGPGRNDWRLTLRQPIQTRDAATFHARGPGYPLFGPNDAVRHPSPRERGLTRDEILEPMTSGQTISRGTIWTGSGVNAQLDAKVAGIRDFVSGFIPGNVVGPEDPGTVISLGRVYLPRLQDEEAREAMTRALDEAEEEWRRDKRSQDQSAPATTFRPGTEASEVDKYWRRSDGERSTRMYPGTDAPHDHGPAGDLQVIDAAHGSTLRAASLKRTQDYAAGLKKGREAQSVTAAKATTAAKVTPAADYAANLKAGRAKKGAA